MPLPPPTDPTSFPGDSEIVRPMQQIDWSELRGELEVLESLTDGFMALDEEWRIRYVNAAAEKANGMA